MPAGLTTRPPLPGPTSPVRSGATVLRALWSGVLSVFTLVGIVAIWASFSSALLAKTVTDGESQPNLIGNYLAGRFARTEHEPAAAAEFYRAALQRDHDDVVLLEHTFQMELAGGHYDRAEPLAQRLVALQPANRMAQTLLALSAFKTGDFASADEHMKAAGEGPIGELTASIGRAWIWMRIALSQSMRAPGN